MRSESYYPRESQFSARLAAMGNTLPRRAMVGIILIISLLAFEMFNFDTTQYALRNLLGEVEFLGLKWASILAIAFCSIDFAGLIRLFTPEQELAEEPREVWYLMGAWLLGATMNAIMTWWAVSLTLLNHNFGNEVLSREQLLNTVPIFVAVLVWLTRILFIGAFTVAGDHIFDFSRAREERPAAAALSSTQPRPQLQPQRAQPASQIINRQRQSTPPPPPEPAAAYEPLEQPAPAPQKRAPAMPQRQNSRVRQRPPRPNGTIRRVPAGVHASPRR